MVRRGLAGGRVPSPSCSFACIFFHFRPSRSDLRLDLRLARPAAGRAPRGPDLDPTDAARLNCISHFSAHACWAAHSRRAAARPGARTHAASSTLGELRDSQRRRPDQWVAPAARWAPLEPALWAAAAHRLGWQPPARIEVSHGASLSLSPARSARNPS